MKNKMSSSIMRPGRVVQTIVNKWLIVQNKTSKSVQSARDAVFRGGMIVACAVLIVWVSIFFYTAFHYTYMPSMSYVRPVHLQFKSCDEDKGVCSFPSAHVQLTKKKQLLMVGQPYKVNLQIEMPESPANKELGMFMVCAQLRSRDGVLVEHSCRSAMLHYRSTLLHILTTLTFSPLMIFGTLEEKQNIVLELFGNFVEDRSHPVTLVYVEIQSRHVEFYSATIMINAHLSGLRYLMFHWPILSAIIGIGTNLFFIASICTFSYIHFVAEQDNDNEDFGFERGEHEEEKELGTNNGHSSESSTEDASPLNDDPRSEEIPPSTSVEPTHSMKRRKSRIQEISSLVAVPITEKLPE